MQLTQFLHRAAQVVPNVMSTRDGDRVHTWSQTRDRVSRVASALRANGIEEGERVGILAMNSDRYFELVHAIWWVGGVVVPLNIRWVAEECIYSLDDSGTKILAFDQTFAELGLASINGSKSTPTGIFLSDGTPPDENILAYETLIEANEPMEDVARSGEDLAGIFYTGGTTGFPKGVMLPHRAIWTNSAAVASQMKLDQHSVYLHSAPMFHIADFACTMANMFVGGSHVFLPGFTADGVIDALADRTVTWTLLVPTMIKLLLDRFEERDDASFGGLEDIVFGASPMPEPLLRQAIALAPDMRWHHAYGQTEMAPMVTIQFPEFITLEGRYASKLNSAGRACYLTHVRVVDADGNDTGPNISGEIIARGPNMMQGYWNKPEETAQAIRNGWVHTGDVGYFDEDGFLYVVDRLKDMIISGGENIFTTEVENAVGSHPDVSEVAVVGIPSETWGEAVHAIIRPVEGKAPTFEDIIAHVEPLIAGFKRPRSIEVRTAPFPVSGAGKVLKRDLRAPFWEGKSKAVN